MLTAKKLNHRGQGEHRGATTLPSWVEQGSFDCAQDDRGRRSGPAHVLFCSKYGFGVGLVIEAVVGPDYYYVIVDTV